MEIENTKDRVCKSSNLWVKQKLKLRTFEQLVHAAVVFEWGFAPFPVSGFASRPYKSAALVSGLQDLAATVKCMRLQMIPR